MYTCIFVSKITRASQEEPKLEMTVNLINSSLPQCGTWYGKHL